MGALLASRLRDLPGATWRALGRTEPSYTDPNSAIVRYAIAATAGIPAIVYGLTPFTMGGRHKNVLASWPESEDSLSIDVATIEKHSPSVPRVE